jgi:hypothetical protein
MKRIAILVALTFLIVLVPAKLAIADSGFSVVPSAFDPHRTHLVAAEWEGGIGCPTKASTAPFLPPDFSTVGSSTYTDPACTTGDPNDKRNAGLLLVKTGPTNDDAAAEAELLGVKGTTLSELGYDIRKPGPGGTIVVFAAPTATLTGDQNDPRGSHCGGGAPRFNITIGGFIYFLACNSPAPDTDTAGDGWQRLRWGTMKPLAAFPQCHDNNCGVGKNNPCTPTTPATGACVIAGQMADSIEIIFDEGQDPSGDPDRFGLAVLDNIDVNTTLVGKGPEESENKDDDKAEGDDNKGDSFQSDDSVSRPESSSLSYEGQSKGMKMQSLNGARTISYTGPCVSYAGDAVMNGNTGYVFSFEACSVSLLGQGIGTFSMTVTGPAGFLYQKIAVPMTSGYVNIHPH